VNFAESVYRHFYCKRKRDAESRRVALPEVSILSVGNISVGGTGKTPAVQWLARRLQNAGLRTVIVGRGYGGEYSARGAIVSDGARVLLNARQAGDEAMLHARALPSTPVVIGRDRVMATKTAIEKFAPQAIVLDDGFQYWSLARDFDLVLLDARRPFGNGKLLPVGRLREPQAELKRADGVLLTRADAATQEEIEAAKSAVQEYSNAPLFLARHAPVSLHDENGGVNSPIEVLRSRRVAAMSALANNEEFFRSLQSCGAQIASTLSRRDHHFWRENEVREFAKLAGEQGATEIITTEKDAVKIASDWTAPLPLQSVVIEMQIESETALWELICAHIKYSH
jgi:tetraacyldisaccharide 4'-kinase